MKIQCSCGSKYTFEVTPEMANQPIHFVCSSCGLDASEYVTNLVRQELGASPAAAGTPVAAPAPIRVAAPVRVALPAAPSASPVAPRLHISKPAYLSETALPAAAVPTASADAPVLCSKHPGQVATERCYMCQKPICPQCMELFGYVCSPLCKAKANSHGIDIPVHEGQSSVVEARAWRKTVWATSAICGVLVLLLGFWVWYRFFGSAPKTVFSLKFPERAHSGQSFIPGKDQIVFLRGGTLARYDMPTQKQIWSLSLIDKVAIEKEVADTIKSYEKLIYKANNEGWEKVPKMPDREKLAREIERSQADALQLKVRGQNVWIVAPGKLTRYDFDSGKPVKEIALKSEYGQIIPRADELLLVEQDPGAPVITHVNLATSESRTEDFNLKESNGSTNAASVPSIAGAVRKPRSTDMAGMPLGTPGKNSDKALDPNRVAQQAQHMSLPQRLALPAVLSNARIQERELKELNEQGRNGPGAAVDDPETRDGYALIPTTNGFLQMSVHLLEEKVTTRSAMKAPTGKSALESSASVGNSADMANEILNEMQRERGGDIVQEDESRYRVTVRKPDGSDSWTGEVVGHPRLYPLQTVNVLAAKKLMIVFDKANKKLWQSTLTYDVQGGLDALDPENSPNGQGPCVEHKDGLFVFDQGVLTAFDLKTGNRRWGYPSVGIAGMFFDDKDAVYVNTTSASIERVKYSRQIDISRKDLDVISKLDSRNGKVLWNAEPGGLVNYVSGKFLYTVQFYQPFEPDEEDPYSADTGFEVPPYLRIKRINPRTGSVLWEHFQQRAPLDVQFDKNTIRLVFRKEVQVLRFLSL